MLISDHDLDLRNFVLIYRYFCVFFLQSNSHADEHSDREEDDMMREECESSDEGVNLNAHSNENETALDFASSPKRSPPNNINIK